MTLPRLILPDSEQETVAAGVLGVGLWKKLVATLKLLGGGSRKQVIEHDGYEVMVEATHQHGQDSGRVRVGQVVTNYLIEMGNTRPYVNVLLKSVINVKLAAPSDNDTNFRIKEVGLPALAGKCSYSKTGWITQQSYGDLLISGCLIAHKDFRAKFAKVMTLDRSPVYNTPTSFTLFNKDGTYFKADVDWSNKWVDQSGNPVQPPAYWSNGWGTYFFPAVSTAVWDSTLKEPRKREPVAYSRIAVVGGGVDPINPDEPTVYPIHNMLAGINVDERRAANAPNTPVVKRSSVELTSVSFEKGNTPYGNVRERYLFSVDTRSTSSKIFFYPTDFTKPLVEKNVVFKKESVAYPTESPGVAIPRLTVITGKGDYVFPAGNMWSYGFAASEHEEYVQNPVKDHWLMVNYPSLNLCIYNDYVGVGTKPLIPEDDPNYRALDYKSSAVFPLRDMCYTTRVSYDAGKGLIGPDYMIRVHPEDVPSDLDFSSSLDRSSRSILIHHPDASAYGVAYLRVPEDYANRCRQIIGASTKSEASAYELDWRARIIELLQSNECCVYVNNFASWELLAEIHNQGVYVILPYYSSQKLVPNDNGN